MTAKPIFGLKKLFSTFCLCLIFGSTYGTDLDDGVVPPKLPSTTLKKLSDFNDGKFIDASFLKDAGGHVGAFVVTGLGQDYTTALKAYQDLAPECLENFDSRLPVFDMADGSQRRTYATEVISYAVLLLTKE